MCFFFRSHQQPVRLNLICVVKELMNELKFDGLHQNPTSNSKLRKNEKKIALKTEIGRIALRLNDVHLTVPDMSPFLL